jgi:Ca2+-binding EF-hand superfamily protein
MLSGSQIVLNVAETACTDPSSNTVDTSLMVTSLVMGSVTVFFFLCFYAWIWLGHSVYIHLPKKKNGKLTWTKKRILGPVTKLKYVVTVYMLLALLSVVSGFLLIIGVTTAASLCSTQTPLLLSFSTFMMIVYWVAMGITLIRIVSMLYYSRMKNALGVKEGEKEPESDIDLVRTIFNSYDKKGDGHMASSDLGSVLEELGMTCSEEEVQNILYEIDKDDNGTISLSEFEAWYIKENNSTKKKPKKKPKKGPVFDDSNEYNVDDEDDDDDDNSKNNDSDEDE